MRLVQLMGYTLTIEIHWELYVIASISDNVNNKFTKLQMENQSGMSW